MKSIFGSAPLLPPAPHQHPRTNSNPNAFIETYSTALQGWAEGNAHYEHQRPRWALTWSFQMIGVSHSVNKKLGRLCAGWKFNYQVIQGRRKGEECKDFKEMGHHFFCQDVFADDGRWIRLPHVAPEARGHTVGSCSSVVGLQCATREMVYWTTPLLSDWVFLQWLPRHPSCHASSLSAEMLLPFFW